MPCQEPPVPAQVAQSVDPVLGRRLWRPVERPGVIDPGPSRAMFTRHQRMVTGLPLAELLSRHTGSTSDLDGASVPIVYALPSQLPPVPDSRPGDAQPTMAPSSPIVSARPVQPAAGPAGSMPGRPALDSAPMPARSPDVPVAHGGAPVAHDVAASWVVQHELVASAQVGPGQVTSTPAQPGAGSAQSEQSGRSASRQVVPPSAVSPLGSAETVARRSSFPDPPPGDRLLRELRTPSRSLPGAAAADPRPTEPGLRRSRTAVADSQQDLPAGVIPAEPGRAHRSMREEGSGMPLAVARPAPAVVHSHARPGEPLLLVDLQAATSWSTRNRALTAEHQESRVSRTPGTGQVPRTGQAASAPRSADRAAPAPAHRQAAAPMDVERIVDAVHRRFVRRLAIEAERRAMR